MAGTQITRYAKGELRKKEILAATVDVICDEGISAVSHRNVAKRAGVASSAPSYFFPSIDDLVVEAFKSVMDTMLEGFDALSDRIVDEKLDREAAVDAYIQVVRDGAIKYDKLQYQAYMFAASRPSLRPAVEAAMAATHRIDGPLVLASGRKDLQWAAPILVALVDGFGLYRVASPQTANFQGLREGLLALMEALPGSPPSAVSDKFRTPKRSKKPRKPAESQAA